MFIFAAAVQGAATRYRGGETGGVGGAAAFCRPGAFGPGPEKQRGGGPAFWRAPALLCAFCAPAAPPTCRRSPAHPYRKAALTRPLPRCARVLVGRLRCTGGRRGARSAPAGRGPEAPGRPVWRPEAAKRRRPPPPTLGSHAAARLYAAFFLLRNRSTARSIMKNSSIRAHRNKGVIP